MLQSLDAVAQFAQAFSDGREVVLDARPQPGMRLIDGAALAQQLVEAPDQHLFRDALDVVFQCAWPPLVGAYGADHRQWGLSWARS